MTTLYIAQAVGTTALLLIAVVAVDRIIALTRAVQRNNDRKEEHEAGVSDVREIDDPST